MFGDCYRFGSGIQVCLLGGLAAESSYSDAGAAGMKMEWYEVWLVKGRCVFGLEVG